MQLWPMLLFLKLHWIINPVIGNGGVVPWMANLDYSASPHIVKNGDLDLTSATKSLPPNDERLSQMRVVSEGGGPAMTEELSCSRPARVEGTLIYRGNSLVPLNDPSLPHGTEVRFDCIREAHDKSLPPPPAAGRSWKIVCHNGR
jgi:hypothetical protein